MNPVNASQSTVCGLAWKRYSRQTPLRDVAPALNGRASLVRGVVGFLGGPTMVSTTSDWRDELGRWLGWLSKKDISQIVS